MMMSRRDRRFIPRCVAAIWSRASTARLFASLLATERNLSANEEAGAQPAVTAQRLDGVRFEFPVASSAWLTRDRSAKKMTARAPSSRLRIVAGLIAMILLASVIVLSLVDGSVSAGKYTKAVFSREEQPFAYWITLSLFIGIFAIGSACVFRSLLSSSRDQKKEPNQPLQRNASTGSVSNFESPARRG
jgi:hypothetical protein